ncbi:hypothetical protein SH668x_000917 [Planctomicrobium sp. SH668]|uniref:hypothetical protein n=1 Tax=Planctomicrobium sp. SH668 TaxID=3448126 RepID=UPI003F5C5103
MSQIRPEIQNILSRLRRWIRRYVLLEGLAATIAIACALFWGSFLIDLAYFKLSNLELPGWFRSLASICMGAVLVGTAVSWISSKLLKRMQPADLALALERQFPELNDRLITAVQLADRAPAGPTSQMLDRTIEEAVSKLSSVRIRETTRSGPLRQRMVIALTLLASVLILGATNTQAMERWYNAYILGKNDYWEPFRQNDLHVYVIAQPGDRPIQFDQDGVYKHPRGSDLQIVADVPAETLSPSQVTMQFLGFSGTTQQRGNVTMSRLGESEFRHTLIRVVNDQELWFRGGDYVNRTPFRIQVVNAPQVDSIDLKCDYPSYTGMDGLEDQLVRVVGMMVALPMETEFDLTASLNKPILKAFVRTKGFELSFGFDQIDGTRSEIPTTLKLLNAATGDIKVLPVEQQASSFIDSDNRKFHVPLVVSASTGVQLAELNESVKFPLPVAPDDVIQISLVDEDQIYSQETTTLTVHGIVDQLPVVDTRRTGIGTSVTRMATIPIEGKLTDDYGVVGAWFGFRIDNGEIELRQPLGRPPSGQKEFFLKQKPELNVEYFNLLPLELQEGQKVALAVNAMDGDTMNGPHTATGELFTFKIVSPDELLFQLADREMTLRLRFEQIRSEIDGIRSLLETHLGSASETAQSDNDKSVMLAYIDRGLHQVRKNHTESRSIEVSFRDLREEMVNNRIDTVELLERIERRVIEPLGLVNEADFLQVDRSLGAARLAVERQRGVQAATSEILPAIDNLLRQIDSILAEMKDRGTLNDVIQNLQKMIEQQEKLLDETENRRIEDDFFTPLN